MEWNKVFGLLHIVNLARQWPNLKHIHDAAMKELVEMKPEEPEKVIPDSTPTIRPRTIKDPKDAA